MKNKLSVLDTFLGKVGSIFVKKLEAAYDVNNGYISEEEWERIRLESNCEIYMLEEVLYEDYCKIRNRMKELLDDIQF